MYAKMAKYLVLFMLLCSMIDYCFSASKVKTTSDVQFIFENSVETTLEGIRYNDIIGRNYSLLVLENTTSFVLNVLQQKNPNERKNVQRVGLIVADLGNHYYIRDGIISVSSKCMYHPGNLRTELNSFLLREITHIWQWNGNGSAPMGLVEGIADFVRLKAGHASPRWVKPGQGDRWDQGFDVTARFLDYCNDLNGKGNFVAELNKKMRDGYSDSFFEELLGKNVDTLWADYKAEYAN